jgi:hypothetical protein
MSVEKPMSFMQELDAWTETKVITPLHEAITDGDSGACEKACESIQKAIRTRVLESYHNGQKAGVTAPARRPVRKEWRR